LLIVSCTALLVSCAPASPEIETGLESERMVSDHTERDSAHPHAYIQGALLGTKFRSLEDLKTVLKVEYEASRLFDQKQVTITHASAGTEVTTILETGIDQNDFRSARDGGFWDRVSLAVRSPYTLMNRDDLVRVYYLSRRIDRIFGEDDVAFFDIAQTMMFNIPAEDLAAMPTRDTTEKGYINTFNHINAQAFMTSVMSEDLADFIADVHERLFPELITGQFSEEQLADLDEGPVDNYVDMINNEWGQELGKKLKDKYGITRNTEWTPELLTQYLNDLQEYYEWALQIEMKPYKPNDALMIKYATKINKIMGDVDALDPNL